MRASLISPLRYRQGSLNLVFTFKYEKNFVSLQKLICIYFYDYYA